MSDPNFINLILSQEGETCLLDGPQMEIRRKEFLSSLNSNLISKEYGENGYKLEFPYTNQIAHDLLDFILKEQTCCSFFEFDLQFKKKSDRILLRIKSSSVDKDVIKEIVDALI